jgi:hypothetical protein
MQDTSKTTGELTIVLRGPDGQVKDQRTIPNLVVTTGRNWLASRTTATPAVMSHMAIGTGTTAPALGDTALQTQTGRVALTSSTTTNNVTTYECTFGAGVGTGAITEAGIFNAASAGTMLNRATFAVVTKGAADVMAITWTLTQS